MFDSGVEEKFARAFDACGTGWTLKREPEPLVAGRHVLIPDFGFEKYGRKVYLEIVGFWTPGYLERKADKLGAVSTKLDMIIAADESLACAKLERLKGRSLVFYYKREVPVKPVVEHLKEVEGAVVREQAARIRPGSLALEGDIVSLEGLARSAGVPLESLKMAVAGADGYVKVGGDLLVSQRKLDEVAGRLQGVVKLTDALRVIAESGFREEDGEKVLNAAGYTSVWEGMDVASARISRRPAAEAGGAGTASPRDPMGRSFPPAGCRRPRKGGYTSAVALHPRVPAHGTRSGQSGAVRYARRRHRQGDEVRAGDVDA